MRSLLLFFFSFLCLGAALYLGYRLLFGSNEITASVTAATLPHVSILTLKQSFLPGDIIAPNAIKWIDFPLKDVPPEQITRDGFIERKQRFFSLAEEVPVGSPVSEAQIIWPSDPKFLSKILRPGKRAIAVSFDRTQALISTLSPGSYLDLAYTGAGEQGSNLKKALSSEIVVSNVRVLTNRNFHGFDELKTQFDNGKASANLILEVSMDQAGVITHAKARGRLTPLLRSVSEPDSPADEEAKHKSNLLSALSANPDEIENAEPINAGSFRSEGRTIFIQRGNKITAVSRGDNPSIKVVVEEIRDWNPND